MNRLLQTHGCDTVFKVPDGLGELMSDISREVLRAQPENIIEFIAKYLTTLMITRENGLLSIRLLKDVCLCREGLEHELIKIGFETEFARVAADIINVAFEGTFKAQEGQLKEKALLVQLLRIKAMTAEEMNIIILLIRKSFKDYQKRMQALKQVLPPKLNEPWEKAAERTINIYESTRPTVEELQKASIKIQAAYKGYFVRRSNILKRHEASSSSSGSVDDDAGSREATFGYKINMDIGSDEEGAEKALVYTSTQTDNRRTSKYLRMDQKRISNKPIRVERKSRLDSITNKTELLLNDLYFKEALKDYKDNNSSDGSSDQ